MHSVENIGQSRTFSHSSRERRSVAEAKAVDEVCRFFVKAGWCKHGAECRLMHPQLEEPSRLRPEKELKEVCQFFVKSRWCKWGDLCKHIHPVEDVEPSRRDRHRSSSPAPWRRSPSPQTARLRLNSWEAREEERPWKVRETAVGAVSHPRRSRSRTRQVVPTGVEICNFFIKAGWCKWAEKCKHLHVQPTEASQVGLLSSR